MKQSISRARLKRGWQVIKGLAEETYKIHDAGSRQRASRFQFATHFARKLSVESKLSNQWINGAHAMPRNWQNNSVPDPVKDQPSVDDGVVPEVLEQTQLDNWRKQLILIRGQILEIAEQGSQQGLVDLQLETVRLAGAIEQLEVLLGRKAAH